MDNLPQLETLFTASFLHTFSKENAKSLLRYLPEEKEAEIKQGLETVKRTQGFSPQSEVESFHFSWLKPALEEFAKPLQNLIVESLSNKQKRSLKKELGLKGGASFIYPEAISFFHWILEKKFRPKEILPIFLINETELSPLLAFGAAKLNKTLHFLGLEDLAREIPNVIDKQVLQKIYNFLSEEEKEFVKQKTRSKNILNLPNLQIVNWAGDKEQLKTILHKRGIVKFASSLSKEDPHFLWHLIHHFDIGRGKLIEKAMETEIQAEIVKELKKNLLKLIDFIK